MLFINKTMNQIELHEAQHENIIHELDGIASHMSEMEDCDADLLKRVEKLEATKVIIAVGHSTRWKAVALSIILGVGFFIGLIVVDVAGGF